MYYLFKNLKHNTRYIWRLTEQHVSHFMLAPGRSSGMVGEVTCTV